MKIKRIVLMSFLSFALAVSGMSHAIPVNAENDSSSLPVLHESEAKNTGGTSAKEAGDSVVLEFSETTNKYAITSANIMSEFSLSSGHSFLDGAGALGSASWSDDGEKLAIVFSAGTSLPSVAVGDTVAVIGTNIKDLSGNVLTGDAVIEGSFNSVDDNDEEECKPESVVGVSSNSDDDDDSDDSEDVDEDSGDNDDDSDDSDEDSTYDDDEDEDEDSDDEIAENDDEDEADEQDDCDDSDEDDHGKYRCGTGLQNGTLYKVTGSDTVYLMADCRLKPFRGVAAFNSRGLKFDSSIQVLTTLPSGASISTEPALPAEGTLVKGSDKTVWFVAKNGKRKGFTSSEIFTSLGFRFEQVDQISDSDLGTIESDDDLVDDSNDHPDGALIKCSNDSAVYQVIDDLRFPFASSEAFVGRGHDFEHILNIDCSRYVYPTAPAIQ